MATARMAWRLLRRDFAAGEVWVLLAALVLAVCALSSVGFITDRAGRALQSEANRLLGGDAVLRSDQPLAAAVVSLAGQLGLQHSETRNFRSMLGYRTQFALAEIRALAPGYPLRGQYRLLAADGMHERRADGIPEPGTLWLSRAGASALGVGIGARLKLGYREFTLAALVSQEPDAALDVFSLGPRAFIHLADLPSTGLEQEGSRIGYRLVVAGDAAAVGRFVAAVQPGLSRGQHLETIAEARPELRSALDRADRFLGLSALLSVVLAAIAVAMAARRHAARHLDGCALLRCLGASQRRVLGIYLGELLWLGLIGSSIGVLLAFLIQLALGASLARLMGIGIPAAGWLPAFEGFAVGAAMLLAFALPPVLALRRVSPLGVLRRDLDRAEPSAWLATALGLLGMAALLWWKAGSAVLAAWLLLGIVTTLAMLALLAAILIAVLRRLRRHLRGPWRYGLAHVSRRAAASAAQIAALGLGLMLILLLTLLRTDLIARWQRAIPADAPDRFLVNVQADQVQPLRDWLSEHGVSAPSLFPMVRARLLAVNGQPLSAGDVAARGERARRLAEREFNLSSSADYRHSDNRIVAGQWWTVTAAGAASGEVEAELSVEQGLAETLGWRLDDRIEFDIAGQRLRARISSLRAVDWSSFQPNFFVLASPGSLDGYAASYIGAFRQPEAAPGLGNALVASFPNLSLIDVGAVLKQVADTVKQVAVAIEYVFYFTLLAGLLVLLAAISASQDERRLEAATLRVLGASNRQLRRAQATEFLAIGALAGVTAAIAASALAGIIAERVFELPWSMNWPVALIGAASGLSVITLTGLLASRRVLAAAITNVLVLT